MGSENRLPVQVGKKQQKVSANPLSPYTIYYINKST
jgi:hypothetical protein